MPFYVRKPIPVEAFEFTGQMLSEMPEWMRECSEITFTVLPNGAVSRMTIGEYVWLLGDMVVRSDFGEPMSCKKESFLKYHEEVEDATETSQK